MAPQRRASFLPRAHRGAANRPTLRPSGRREHVPRETVPAHLPSGHPATWDEKSGHQEKQAFSLSPVPLRAPSAPQHPAVLALARQRPRC